MAVLFGNNVTSNVSGSVAPGSGSVQLAAGTGILFPQPVSPDYFIATFIDAATGTQREIVHVTSITGDTAFITRAQESTPARAWNAGDIFANLHTAGAMQAMMQKGAIPPTSIIYKGTDVSTVANSINVPTTIPPLTVPPADGMLFLIQFANNNTSSNVNIVIAGQPPLPLVHAGGRSLDVGEINNNGEVLIYNYQNASYRFLNISHLSDSGTVHVGTDTSPTINQIIASTLPTPGAYNTGMIYSIYMTHTNTSGSVFADFDNLGNFPVIGYNRSLVAGDLVAGYSTLFVYNAGSFVVFNGAGATGPIGHTGPTGPTGAAATIAVGTTTTLGPGSAATVANAGSAAAAVFNFGIPQGAVGPAGPTGASGYTGSYGQIGSIYVEITGTGFSHGTGFYHPTANNNHGDWPGVWTEMAGLSYITDPGGSSQGAFFYQRIA